jgi:hypothetical protein
MRLGAVTAAVSPLGRVGSVRTALDPRGSIPGARSQGLISGAAIGSILGGLRAKWAGDPVWIAAAVMLSVAVCAWRPPGRATPE